MATVEDRLRQSRALLDKWTTREQLCLASAVSSGGDQNWMSVSRTMKLVCGTGANGVPRPPDWYSQKKCAVQYGNLLENVETPKRKKRTSESSAATTEFPATNTVDTPTDLILRKLTEERVQELMDDIKKNQEEYAKIYMEIKELQTSECSEERLMSMWREMEKEEEAKRIDEMKLENQLREREQRKQNLQRNWHAISSTTTTAANNENEQESATVEATINVHNIDKSKPTLLNIMQVDATQQPQTSPLLSSLLKSPTSNVPTHVTITSVASSSTSSVYSTAPTITNLLTGGSMPNDKQPVVVVKNTEIGQALNRPISGPPKTETNTAAGVAQNMLSPSQSAPTLSMLLEKNKSTGTTEQLSMVSAGNKVKIDEEFPKDVEQQKDSAADSNNDEIPKELEEEIEALRASDPNCSNIQSFIPEIEEQQLLEVFKNIGNLEMEIDTEFLTAMQEERNSDGDISNFVEKMDTFNISPKSSNKDLYDDNIENKKEDHELSAELKPDNTNESCNNNELENKRECLEKNETITSEELKTENAFKTTETISSDDSNDDNIPLAAVATSLEEVKEQQNATDNDNDNDVNELKQGTAVENELNNKNLKGETTDTITAEIVEYNEEIKDTNVVGTKQQITGVEITDEIEIISTDEEPSPADINTVNVIKEENKQDIEISTKGKLFILLYIV